MLLLMEGVSKEKGVEEKTTDNSQVSGKFERCELQKNINSRKTLTAKPYASLDQGQRGGTWGEGVKAVKI